MNVFRKIKNPISPSLDNYLSHIFDTIDPNIKLDNEQKAAVINDDKYSLVIAGAGTGKTTTVAAKVKYLVDIKKIDPQKILVMSYTKKATEELRRRINTDFDIPADITTFHSLGYRYLRLLNPDKKIVPLDDNEKNAIFLNYLKENIFPYKEKVEEMVSLFNDDTISWETPQKHTYGSFFKEHFNEFNSFDKYFEAYVQKKISETPDIVTRTADIADSLANSEHPRTINNERVKSKGEAIIANYLFCNNIDYTYEKVYDELVGNSQIYRPDFTIDFGGEKIYIEYFGMSGSQIDNNSYNKIRRQKEAYHRAKNNKFIALDYKPNRGYLSDLAKILKSYGIIPKPKSDLEVYRRLLENNPLAELFGLKNFLYETIEIIKNSDKSHSKQEIIKTCEKVISNSKPNNQRIMRQQLSWIFDFWKYYSDACRRESKEMIDFNDMIKEPITILHKLDKAKMQYDYIIVDEYQDISSIRYELLKMTVDRCDAKLMVVGDDWQSIYSFMGGKIKYIYNFSFYFPGAKYYYITKTYRNSQSLIDCAGTFIMKNNSQIKKQLISSKTQNKPINIVPCKKVESINVMISIIKLIHTKYPNDSILVLTHTNYAIKTILNNNELRDSAENKVSIKNIPNFYFDLMTIHKSKGLTYDWCIIAPLSNHFPHDPISKFWLTDAFRNNPEDEQIEYPEFRRLFYVALTRAKRKVIIICDKNRTNRSRYINDIEKIQRLQSANTFPTNSTYSW